MRFGQGWQKWRAPMPHAVCRRVPCATVRSCDAACLHKRGRRCAGMRLQLRACAQRCAGAGPLARLRAPSGHPGRLGKHAWLTMGMRLQLRVPKQSTQQHLSLTVESVSCYWRAGRHRSTHLQWQRRVLRCCCAACTVDDGSRGWGRYSGCHGQRAAGGGAWEQAACAGAGRQRGGKGHG